MTEDLLALQASSYEQAQRHRTTRPTTYVLRGVKPIVVMKGGANVDIDCRIVEFPPANDFGQMADLLARVGATGPRYVRMTITVATAKTRISGQDVSKAVGPSGRISDQALPDACSNTVNRTLPPAAL
jgi:hypothetical protein